jgi:ATP-dependent helicase/nuclease subunit A
VVREAFLSRDHFMAWTDAAGSAEAAAAQMSAALGVAANDSIEDVEREIVDGPYLRRSGWEEIAGVLDTGSKSDQDQAARLPGSAGVHRKRAGRCLPLRVSHRSRPHASQVVVTKKFCDNNPAIGRLFEAEVRRIQPLIERRRAVSIRDRTEALLHIATAAAANYRREKLERGPARLRRPDRQDARNARPRLLGLGALQARPRRRSCV